MGRAHRPRPKRIVARPLHALLQPDHVCDYLHDSRQQREGTAPPGDQGRSALHQLRNQMLRPPAIVLHTQIPFNLMLRQGRAAAPLLDLGQYLRTANVCLVAQAILPPVNQATAHTILIPHPCIVSHADVWAGVADRESWPEHDHILPLDGRGFVLSRVQQPRKEAIRGLADVDREAIHRPQNTLWEQLRVVVFPQAQIEVEEADVLRNRVDCRHHLLGKRARAAVKPRLHVGIVLLRIVRDVRERSVEVTLLTLDLRCCVCGEEDSFAVACSARRHPLVQSVEGVIHREWLEATIVKRICVASKELWPAHTSGPDGVLDIRI
eukprot:1761295-Prymnesium_polylepis.1